MAPYPPLIILVGLQADGATYALEPRSRQRIQEAFPGVPVAPSVFVGYKTREEFEALHGPMWRQIVILLTGVTLERLRETLGEVIVRVPGQSQDIAVEAAAP